MKYWTATATHLLRGMHCHGGVHVLELHEAGHVLGALHELQLPVALQSGRQQVGMSAHVWRQVMFVGLVSRQVSKARTRQQVTLGL